MRDNVGSALHTQLSYYENGIKNYRLLVEHYNNLLDAIDLTYADLPSQSRHKAHHIISLIWLLYKNYYSAKERKERLKNDLAPDDYKLLEYYKSNKIKQVAVFLLKKKHLILFDYYTSCIVKLWKFIK